MGSDRVTILDVFTISGLVAAFLFSLYFRGTSADSLFVLFLLGVFHLDDCPEAVPTKHLAGFLVHLDTDFGYESALEWFGGT